MDRVRVGVLAILIKHQFDLGGEAGNPKERHVHLQGPRLLQESEPGKGIVHNV